MSTTQSIPLGYCQCGCGAKTALIEKNNTKLGRVKGQPSRYLRGHSNRRTLDCYRVEDRGYETPCWIWQMTVDHGYPRVKRDGRMQQAHRAFWEERHGIKLPRGHDIEMHHLCEQKLCVNPDHVEPLEVLTHRREHSNVTMEIARAVRRRYRPRIVTAAMLAAEYGITRKQVRHIVAGHIWREKE